MAAIWPIAFELWDKRVRSNFVFVYCGFIWKMLALLFGENGGLNVVRNVVRNGKLFRINQWVMENV